MQITMPLGTLSRLGLLASLLLTCASIARGQAAVNPIEFTYDYPRIGGEIGLTPTWQSGIYRSGCGEFVEGARINPLLALAYDHPIVDDVARFEILAGWMLHSVSSRYTSRETVVLQTDRGTARVEVDFENEGDLSVSYFFLLPSVKIYLMEALYAGGGLSAGLLSSATTQYRKTILTKSLMIPELGLSEVSYPEEESDDPYTKIFPEEERPDAQGFALDLALYVGAEFKLSERLHVGPRILFAYPVTTVLSDPDLKLLSMQLTLGVRYALFR